MTEMFKIERTFDAPRERVFDAWTSAEALARWWGPKGLGLRVAALDMGPGGIFHYTMIAPGGVEMWGRFIFREIVRPEKIIFVSSFSDAEGAITRVPADEEWPRELLNHVYFDDLGDGRTRLRLEGNPVNATDAEIAVWRNNFESMQGGFGGTFEKLDDYLAGRL